MDGLGATGPPISAAHALAAASLSWDHRDPFDRIFAAQAMLEAMPFVASDHVFTDPVQIADPVQSPNTTGSASRTGTVITPERRHRDPRDLAAFIQARII